jgi:hypothetical protein
MSGLVERVIIWRGTLSTHNLFWMGGSLTTVIIRRSIALMLWRSRAIWIRMRGIARLWWRIVAWWWITWINRS